jgi:hypothetical protein
VSRRSPAGFVNHGSVEHRGIVNLMHRAGDQADATCGFGIAGVLLRLRVGVTGHGDLFQRVGQPVAFDADHIGKIGHASSFCPATQSWKPPM